MNPLQLKKFKVKQYLFNLDLIKSLTAVLI